MDAVMATFLFRLVRKSGFSVAFLEYDESIPMVDKAIDAGWKKEVSNQRPPVSKDTHKPPKGILAQTVAMLMAFIMTIFVLLWSFIGSATKNLSYKISEPDHISPIFSEGAMLREEFHSPSHSPGFTDADLLSSILKRREELEEKLTHYKQNHLKCLLEKEELLDAAIRHVDALEAVLIATKKTLFTALMRQEEFLAYIDRQEAKFRISVDGSLLCILRVISHLIS